MKDKVTITFHLDKDDYENSKGNNDFTTLDIVKAMFIGDAAFPKLPEVKIKIETYENRLC